MPVKAMPKRRRKPGRVSAYSYTRIAGNYVNIFSKPGKFILLLFIIIVILIISIIFLRAVFS